MRDDSHLPTEGRRDAGDAAELSKHAVPQVLLGTSRVVRSVCPLGRRVPHRDATTGGSAPLLMDVKDDGSGKAARFDFVLKVT
jgi:hypothetical protein